MNQVKHEEAPWWVTERGIRNRGGYICFTNPVQCYDGQGERFERETAERKASRALIAAAPELLAELKDILSSIDGGGRVVTFGDVDIERYRAAIAKATGSAA